MVQTKPGMGAGTALGVPLLELVGLITAVTGSDTGTIFQDTLLNAMNFGPAPLKPLEASGEETEIIVVGKGDASLLSILPISICGLMGLESALLLLTFLGFTMVPLRRRN